jgi:putative GTP pyrophosphokinase
MEENFNNEISNVNYIKEKEQQFKRIMLMYNSALKEIETKISIISDEFQMLYKYNPIEHIKTRIKSPESIVKKLRKKGYPVTYNSLLTNINDVAGIRIVCSFIPDIYKIVDMLESSKDINVIEKKDYIKNPKESGYSSYHLIATVPVSFASGVANVKVEIQIRTIAMDFWASLEHKIKYKYPNKVPKNISKELKESAKMVTRLDKKMSNLGRNLIDEFEHDMVVNKSIQIEETKMLDSPKTDYLINDVDLDITKKEL